MTTLSWLLITASVAGLAALAVVLVQSQVETTAEQVSDAASRRAAAAHSAFAVETDAKAAAARDFDTWADWERHFSRECDIIAVLYAGTEIEMANNFMGVFRGTIFDAAAARYAAAADEQPATATKAQVQCEVG
ncbi:MAG: hypothetical protein OXC06_05400 [Acidimicrobiaceae bacterium]|nr:hypothetical protein [Acidimicrobiaceae bacterium]